MRTLHFYLTRQVLATLLMTVAVFTFVLLLGNVLREILALLVNRQVSFWTVAQAIGLLIPWVLAFALPMGMLTATLLVFGRFSADNELTAIRASGVSLLALVTPVLLLSVVCSALSAVVIMQVAPRSRMLYKQLLFGATLARGGALIPERTYVRDFPGCIVYANRVNGTNLGDILIYRLEGGKIASYVRAAHGSVGLDRARGLIRVELRNAYGVGLEEGGRLPQPVYLGATEFTYTNTATSGGERMRLSDMTHDQLWAELRSLERQFRRTDPVAGETGERMRERLREMRAARWADVTSPVRVQIHRQVAFSFACIGFTLVGIPLGIRAHRRETSWGFALALILVLFYYGFFIVGQALSTRPEWAPHLLLWLPNFLFQAAGLVLLRRADRGV